MIYCDKSELSDHIRDYQANKVITEPLLNVLYKIARGLQSKYHFPIESEDLVHDAVLTCLQKLDRIDPAKNCFSYLTTICFNSFRGQVRSQKTAFYGLLDYATAQGVKIPKEVYERYRPSSR